MSDDLHQIKGLPIFKAGTWNGDHYSTNDLDEMIHAFDKVGFNPPVKLGHDSTVGGRAWGWVKRIWREGNQLLADLGDIPAGIFDKIKQRAFDNVSAEIIWEMKRNGTIYRRVLSGLALLSGEIPAVDLPPIRDAQLLGIDLQSRKYLMPLDTTDAPASRCSTEAAIHEMALQYAHDADVDYRTALARVMTDPRNQQVTTTYNIGRSAGQSRPQSSAARRNAR
jgi:hypothetical protein